MNKIKLMAKFFDTMHRVHKVAGLESVDAKHSVATPLQVDALLYLREHAKSTASELGKHLQLSSSATTQLINRLDESDLIIRENSPDDRRLTILSITSKGKDAFTKMHNSRISKLKSIVSLMPEKDVRELIRIFSNVLENIETKK